MANSIAVDQVTLAKVADGGDIPEELVEEIHAASADATQALSDASDASDAASAAATAAEDAAKTATSFITTDESSVCFHPENDSSHSIKIDGDSVDFYKDDNMLASIRTAASNGRSLCEISSGDLYGGIVINSSIKSKQNMSKITTSSSSDGANMQHIVDGGEMGTIEHNYSCFTNVEDVTDVLTVGNRHIRVAYGVIGKTLKPYYLASISDGESEPAKIEAGVDSSKSYVNISADNVNVNGNGATITLYGNTSTNVTNKTTATNVLAGRCAVETGTGDDDVFTADTTAGTIEAKKDGVYLIKSSSYHTTNYTSGDIIHNHINIVGKTDFGYERNVKRVTNGSAYDVLQATAIKVLSAGDKIQQQVYNQTSARGYVVTNGTTALQVVKIG